ncbi:MAG: UPF0149 family protein [Gammaproteobacteria bacterium]
MVEYCSVDEALVTDGIPYSPAELHGQLIGRLSVGLSTFSFESWLTELAEDVVSQSDIKAWSSTPLLAQWCAESMDVLLRGDMDLQLALPEGEVDARDLAEALAEWVNGFLVGLALGGLRSEDLNSELLEMLEDLRAISQVDTAFSVDDAAAEKHLVELIEYVRLVIFHVLETDRARKQWARNSPVRRSKSVH